MSSPKMKLKIFGAHISGEGLAGIAGVLIALFALLAASSGLPIGRLADIIF